MLSKTFLSFMNPDKTIIGQLSDLSLYKEGKQNVFKVSQIDAIDPRTLASAIYIPSARLPNDPMLNIWLNMKNNCSMKKIKIGERHATAFGFLRVWYKYKLR